MAAAVAQHAAERKLFVTGKLAAANGSIDGWFNRRSAPRKLQRTKMKGRHLARRPFAFA
jgi:hypothetical protein